MADPVYDDDGIDRITLTFAVVLANRYSWAICMKRARRAVVSALRASSKQHLAKSSNCLPPSLPHRPQRGRSCVLAKELGSDIAVRTRSTSMPPLAQFGHPTAYGRARKVRRA